MSIPPTIEYASLGMWDSLILMVMALVVFGPRRMPEIGRQIGRLMYELRKASSDFKFQMEEELRNAEDSDRRKKEEARLQALTLAAPAGTVAASQTPEAESGTPAATEEESATTSASESPYPGEEQYPPIDPAVAQETPVEGVAEETVPSDAAAVEASPTDSQGTEQLAATPEKTSTEPVNQNG